MRKALGAWTTTGLLSLAAACGGAAVPPPVAPAPTVAPDDHPNGGKGAPAQGGAAAGAWTLPEGPRDAARPPADGKPVDLGPWRTASKAKGVGPVPACPKRAGGTDAATAIADATAALPTCADALIDPLLLASKAGQESPMLVGLSLSGKLARTAENVPVMKDTADKAAVKRFIKGPLRGWMVEQATAIDTLSAPAVALPPSARAIVAVEAGMADLRLVDKIRSAPTPSTWDKELKAVYEAALDEALEPRKTRGRDAALVGLNDFAADAALENPRVDRARALLSKLYGGRRVDALDALVLPPGGAEPSAARRRFELGRRYWRRVDFVEAAHAGAQEKDEGARLVLALSLSLAKGPNGAREMMVAASPAALGLDHTDALDALVAENGKLAGMAAFDAAHLRSLSVPDGAAAGAYLSDVATRFRKAASLLDDPALKRRAEERAADAEAAAKAVR